MLAGSTWRPAATPSDAIPPTLLSAADRGEVEDWDIQSIKSEGRRILH